MELRKAESADLQPLAELWALSFPSDRPVADRIRQLETGVPYGGIESAWLIEERGRLLGGFRASRFIQHMGGARLPMLGLAAVATAPDARRRGVGRHLCLGALRIGRDRGDVVSVLFPFRPAYYRDLGWGFAGSLDSHRFPPSALAATPPTRAVRMAEPEDWEAIAACYARVLARSHGPIERDDAIWACHRGSARVRAVVFEAATVNGYALIRFGSGRSPGSGTLTILELVTESDDAYRALLGWIAAQRDQVAVVRYDAKPAERFDLRLSEPRPPGSRPSRGLWFPTARRLRGPMLRVLDVPTALAARRMWGPVRPGLRLAIEVVDGELPENRGPWELTTGEDGVRVRSHEGGTLDASLATDASTFAQIYAGEVTPSAAVRLGTARTDDREGIFDRLFQLDGDFWLLDEF